MSAATDRVRWIAAGWDRSQSSDGVSRYGAYLWKPGVRLLPATRPVVSEFIRPGRAALPYLKA